MGADGHHERFKTICKLDPQSWGVQEHYQATQYIKALLLNDQIDGTKGLGAELILRRMQTIEYAHAKRAKESESKGIGGRRTLEEQSAFAGVSRVQSSVMVAPSLLEHVRSDIERDASVSKNLRKAREEREALRRKSDGK